MCVLRVKYHLQERCLPTPLPSAYLCERAVRLGIFKNKVRVRILFKHIFVFDCQLASDRILLDLDGQLQVVTLGNDMQVCCG